MSDTPKHTPPCALRPAPRSPERATYLLTLVLGDLANVGRCAAITVADLQSDVSLETHAGALVALADRLEVLATRIRRLAAPFTDPGVPWPPSRPVVGRGGVR